MKRRTMNNSYHNLLCFLSDLNSYDQKQHFIQKWKVKETENGTHSFCSGKKKMYFKGYQTV